MTDRKATQAERRRAHRSALGASIRFSGALCASTCGLYIGPRTLEELELDARWAKVEYETVRTRTLAS